MCCLMVGCKARNMIARLQCFVSTKITVFPKQKLQIRPLEGANKSLFDLNLFFHPLLLSDLLNSLLTEE